MRQKIRYILIIFFLSIICGGYVSAGDSVLKWNASTGDVSGYIIYYGIAQGNYPFSEDVGDVTEYALSNFSLSEGTTYYFVVRAYNATGESGDSNVTIYSVPDAGDTTPPLSPQGVAGEIVDNDIVLTWQANSEPDFSVYRVYYGTSSRDYGLPIPVDGTEYSISGLDTDVAYYFAVTVVDGSGNESGPSSPEVVKTIAVAYEGTMLKWDTASGDISGYRIYYGTSEENYTENIDVGDVTQYALENFSLTEGVTYYFVIRAYNDSGESDSSNVATYIIGEPTDTTDPVVTITAPTSSTTYGTQSDSINLSGTSSDDTGTSSVTWSSSRGPSGTATGTSNWSAAGISLSEGTNVLTLTAKDAAGNTSTDTLTITYTKPDTTAPVVTITSPTTGTTYGTQSDSVNLRGISSDDSDINSVSWSNSRGGNGQATGTTSWEVSDIVLANGENIITIQAEDEFGNFGVKMIAVNYTPPPEYSLPTLEIGKVTV